MQSPASRYPWNFGPVLLPFHQRLMQALVSTCPWHVHVPFHSTLHLLATHIPFVVFPTPNFAFPPLIFSSNIVLTESQVLDPSPRHLQMEADLLVVCLMLREERGGERRKKHTCVKKRIAGICSVSGEDHRDNHVLCRGVGCGWRTIVITMYSAGVWVEDHRGNHVLCRGVGGGPPL